MRASSIDITNDEKEKITLTKQCCTCSNTLLIQVKIILSHHQEMFLTIDLDELQKIRNEQHNLQFFPLFFDEDFFHFCVDGGQSMDCSQYLENDYVLGKERKEKEEKGHVQPKHENVPVPGTRHLFHIYYILHQHTHKLFFI